MAEFYFREQLKPENIKKIKEENKFRDPYSIERFIMDFEVFAHIREKIPDCVIKGGMAVPFHIKDRKVRRLSVDIDMVTGYTRDEVIAAMGEIRSKIAGKIAIPENHVPKKGQKHLPLLTYYCEYESGFHEQGEIKIEIFHDNELQIRTKDVSAPEEIMGVTIDVPVKIYDHNSLIGDKMTTLPFNTIGIDPSRELDVPKQIYDISSLINSTSDSISMKEIIYAFGIIAREEISYYTKNAPEFESILEDLVRFPERLLHRDKIKLNPPYEGRFDKFKTELLGDAKYKSYDHLADIFLLKIMAILIQKFFKKEMEIEVIDSKIKIIVEEKKDIVKMTDKEATKILRGIVGKRGPHTEHGKIIKTMFPVQGYLYDKILELEGV